MIKRLYPRSLMSTTERFCRPLKLPENRECADCKNKGPRWESVNLGVFICKQCSGIHRSLGVHISKFITCPSILEKAGTTLEVFRGVLNVVGTQHPEGAKDEFTLDLVEQCSFQKQRVMHLAMTSRDENVVSQAIELNEHLERVLRRHDALLACRTTSTRNHIDHQQIEVEEEKEAEQLFRRMRKGKACIRPEDDGDHPIDRPLVLIGLSVPSKMLHRPFI